MTFQNCSLLDAEYYLQEPGSTNSVLPESLDDVIQCGWHRAKSCNVDAVHDALDKVFSVWVSLLQRGDKVCVGSVLPVVW